MSWKGSVPSVLLSLMILSGGLPLLADGLELPASAGRAGSLWVWNLGDRTAQVNLASGRSLHIAAGAFREVPGQRSGRVSFHPGSQVVFVSASRNLDPSAFELDLRGTVQQDEAEPGLVHVTRPAWAQDLLAQAAGRSAVGSGGTLDAVTEIGEDGRARFAVGLLDAGSAAVVTLRDGHGTALQTFSVAAAMPVRLRADLGLASEIDDARAEVKVVRGHAVTRASRGGIQRKSIQGTCVVNPGNLIFSGSYTYSCTGGQPNACGSLEIVRNGVSQSTPGWFCTDSSGNGTMGPWNWSDKPSDETGDPLYIGWPNGNTSNSTYIIVDKSYAQTYIDSSMPTSSTPTSYNGHATDATWGTGFDFGFVCFSVFQNLTTGNYWSPGTGQYNAGYTEVTPSVSHSGRWYISWTTSFPNAGAHTTGNHYQWYTCCTDAMHGYCTGAGPGFNNPYQFTAN